MRITRLAAAGAAIAFAALLAGGLLFLPPSGAARAEALSDIRVIDGDTIEDRAASVTYRIVNIDTPETGARAQCAAERALGASATQRTRALIAGADRVETRPTGRTDRYGRAIAFVLIDGRDLGETLIAEGLARPWRGRREPWCDAGGALIP